MKISCYSMTSDRNLIFVIENGKGKFDTIYSYESSLRYNNYSILLDLNERPNTPNFEIEDTTSFDFKQRDAFNSIAIEHTQRELPRTVTTLKEFIDCYKPSILQRIWILIIVMMYKYDGFTISERKEFLILLLIYHSLKYHSLKFSNKLFTDKYITKLLNTQMAKYINTEIAKV